MNFFIVFSLGLIDAFNAYRASNQRQNYREIKKDRLVPGRKLIVN